jgi:2-oxoglutarate dehydrogenase E2 component (dihydrolipoamide succinyltransferase)
MAIAEMVMPRLGESVIECTVISILKKIGDRVEADDSVLEVATDKVDTEVPCPLSGTITEILVKEGDVLPIGGLVMRIEVGGQSVVDSKQSAVGSGDVPNKQLDSAEEPPVFGLADTPLNPIADLQISTPSLQSQTNRFYSPLVLTIARTEGISQTELDQIAGTGAEGRVTKHDILGYLSGKKSAGQSSQVKVTSKPVQLKPVQSLSGQDEIIEMDRMRKMIAERMVDSKRISPHVSSFVECDMTNIVRWREGIKDRFKKETGEGITFTPILIEAVAQSIREMPMINISVEGDKIIKKGNINVGMAVALPSGNLIVPVIHRADQYDLVQLSLKVNDLATRARNNKLTADDLAGGTYSISNIGTFGNVMGTPIILQPQVAIMAFGAIQKKPVVIETPQGDTIGIRQMMFLSHSYDHRVVDGALGGMFVKRVAELLENFDVERKLF